MPNNCKTFTVTRPDHTGYKHSIGRASAFPGDDHQPVIVGIGGSSSGVSADLHMTADEARLLAAAIVKACDLYAD